eukprot:c43661_g1_i1 orf=568-1029(-)
MQNGKGSKMLQIIKKWQKVARVGSAYSAFDQQNAGGGQRWDNSDSDPDDDASHSQSGPVPDGFAVVYIGKSRRRFRIPSRHVNHPLFKLLVERSEECGVNQSQGLTLGCEVVLFKHLLWLLDSEDPAIAHKDSLEELAEFYIPVEQTLRLKQQ